MMLDFVNHLHALSIMVPFTTEKSPEYAMLQSDLAGLLSLVQEKRRGGISGKLKMKRVTQDAGGPVTSYEHYPPS